MDGALEKKLLKLENHILHKSEHCVLNVFAYGSLMWKPEFPYKKYEPACLYGYHRRLAIFSTVYRGTEKMPGLCFGLDRGGCCNGVMFEIANNKKQAVIAYLFKREMFADAYIPRYLTAIDAKGNKKKVLTFIVNPHAKKYAPPMSIEKTKQYINRGVGIGGTNVEYIQNSQQMLENLNIHSPKLNGLCRQLCKKV